jgi:hypothetical protein
MITTWIITGIIAKQATAGGITLAPPLLAGAGALFAPTVAAGGITLAPPLLSGMGALFAPTVAAGATTLAPPLLAGAGALFAPTVAAGAITLTPPLLAGLGALFAPAIIIGPVTITLPLLDASGALFAPGVTIILPAIPGIDWAPPVDLATSSIIAQALRYMRLPPVARFDASAEVLVALPEAVASAMDDCLAVADWSFASVLVQLPGAALPNGDMPDDGMPYAYQPPGDMIALRQIMPSCARYRMDKGLLRSDQPAPLTLRYTARVTIEAALPATFRDAVSLHIAARLGARWAGSTVASDDLTGQAAARLLQARRDDARQASPMRALPANDNLGYGGSDDWATGAVA